MKYYTNRRLLDKVCYVSREKRSVENLCGEKIEVRDTFPYNPESKTAPMTATNWAKGYSANLKFDSVERVNEPFNVTLVDLHVRSEGGRAYKVVDEDNRQFDMREDQLLEVFKMIGIQPGGKIPGQFVWGVLGSQMHLTLVGGTLYNEMLTQANQLKDFKEQKAAGLTPTESSLKFGHIYRKRDQSLHIFVGKAKIPGNNKNVFAFVELPEMPGSHDEIDFESPPSHIYEGYITFWKRERELALKWASLNWFERCTESWTDRWGNVRTHYQNIIMMSSPKFEADTGEECNELAQHLRDNVGCHYTYVNGYNIDLAEALWSQKNGVARRNWYNPNSNYSLSFDDRKKQDEIYRQKVQEEYNENFRDFQSKIVWI